MQTIGLFMFEQDPDVSRSGLVDISASRGQALSLDVTLNLPCLKIRGPATPVVQSWYKQRHINWAVIRLKLFSGIPCKTLIGLIALLAQLCVYKLYMGEREKHLYMSNLKYSLLSSVIGFYSGTIEVKILWFFNMVTVWNGHSRWW